MYSISYLNDQITYYTEQSKKWEWNIDAYLYFLQNLMGDLKKDNELFTSVYKLGNEKTKNILTTIKNSNQYSTITKKQKDIIAQDIYDHVQKDVFFKIISEKEKSKEENYKLVSSDELTIICIEATNEILASRKAKSLAKENNIESYEVFYKKSDNEWEII